MRACLNCRYVVISEKVCPKCGSKEFTEHFVGLVIILSPDKSEIAELMGIKEETRLALKLKK